MSEGSAYDRAARRARSDRTSEGGEATTNPNAPLGVETDPAGYAAAASSTPRSEGTAGDTAAVARAANPRAERIVVVGGGGESVAGSAAFIGDGGSHQGSGEGGVRSGTPSDPGVAAAAAREDATGSSDGLERAGGDGDEVSSAR